MLPKSNIISWKNGGNVCALMLANSKRVGKHHWSNVLKKITIITLYHEKYTCNNCQPLRSVFSTAETKPRKGFKKGPIYKSTLVIVRAAHHTQQHNDQTPNLVECSLCWANDYDNVLIFVRKLAKRHVSDDSERFWAHIKYFTHNRCVSY